MEPFASLEPNLRAYALVGYYLSGFAAMESALNDCISKALRLDLAQGFIVTRNLQFRNKVKILRALINEALIVPDEKARYDKVALSLNTMSEDRNIFAHELFAADEKGDGVSFFVAKASAKLHFPEVRLSIIDVDDRHSKLFHAAMTLKEMIPFFTRSDLVKALMAREQEAPSPNGGLLGLGALYLGASQPPSDPDFDPPETIESTGSQTPEDPMEKG